MCVFLSCYGTGGDGGEELVLLGVPPFSTMTGPVGRAPVISVVWGLERGVDGGGSPLLGSGVCQDLLFFSLI